MNTLINSVGLRVFIALVATLLRAQPLMAANSVDFAYSPPKWQTAICLPDDSEKTIVDSSGTLLYHFERGNFKKSEREFGTRISIETSADAKLKTQKLYSPRVPIVQTYRVAGKVEILEEVFAVTEIDSGQAKVILGAKAAGPAASGAATKSTVHGSIPEGVADQIAQPRNDLILVHVFNSSDVVQNLKPRLVVDTSRDFAYDRAAQQVTVNKHEVITASLKMTDFVAEDKTHRVIQFETIEVAPRGNLTFAVCYHGGGVIALTPSTVAQAKTSREQAIQYWKKAPLPYGRVEVPDAGIQALVDSSIRNIWQAREIKNGLPVFQVGPTCYRDLWIVDGAFILEAATMLGSGEQARNGITHELTFQKPDGRIHVLEDFTRTLSDGTVEVDANFTKENGIVLWTCYRHALLTQDKAWLESIWPRLERIAEFIRHLRQETLTNDTPLDDGLVPPGFADGGIWGTHPEYTNVYWNMVGLHAFASASQWLGKDKEADEWRKEYEDFISQFRRSAKRDMKTDSHGNYYLPIRMDGQDLPQRGQWAFLHAVYPGQLFDLDAPLAAGNMAMLEATEREGMVYGTGWQAEGIWNYFASFYGHAWLWLGNGPKAVKALYSFGNHAAPTLAWREEQTLKGTRFEEVGDMPHNWASAEFIRLTVHLIAIDRGTELHLFEGVPSEWAHAGARTSLSSIATPFGPLNVILDISKDHRTAHIRIEPLSDRSCTKIIVHLDGWAGKTDKSLIELDPRKHHSLEIPINN